MTTETIPAWAKYKAKDANGAIFYYENHPRVGRIAHHMWLPNGGELKESSEVGPDDGQLTLQKIEANP